MNTQQMIASSKDQRCRFCGRISHSFQVIRQKICFLGGAYSIGRDGIEVFKVGTVSKHLRWQVKGYIHALNAVGKWQAYKHEWGF